MVGRCGRGGPGKCSGRRTVRVQVGAEVGAATVG